MVRGDQNSQKERVEEERGEERGRAREDVRIVVLNKEDQEGEVLSCQVR